MLHAQVGINTSTPNNTLHVNGSFGIKYQEITADYTLTDNDCFLQYTGSADATFTLPATATTAATAYTGRVYKFKNLSSYNLTIQASGSDLIRVNDNAGVSSFVIPGGSYTEVVKNSSTTAGVNNWDLTFLGLNSNVDVVYGIQLQIPPHDDHVNDFNNHTNSDYDTGDWHVFSKESFGSDVRYGFTRAYGYVRNINYTEIRPSRMTIVYELQGPPIDVSNTYPMLSAGNDLNYPDVFTCSFIRLENVAGKTRLSVSVSRADLISDRGSTSSNWAGTFLLNVVLAKKVY